MTTECDDHHFLHIAVADRKVSSTVLCLRWSTTTGVELSVSKIRRRILRAGARMSLRWLPLSRNHRLRLQWTSELRHYRAEWQNVFSKESRFNLSYNYVRIRVDTLQY